MILLAGVLGFGLTHDPRALPSALVGHRAPEFSLRTLEGDQTVRLSDLRGHPIVINFWASWCLACYREHPNFVAAWQRYGDRGVVFLGIIYQDRPALARDFMRRYGGGWPNLLDSGGRAALSFGLFGVPETFFIDSAGVIRYKQVGYSSYELLRTQIDGLLRDPGGAPAQQGTRRVVTDGAVPS